MTIIFHSGFVFRKAGEIILLRQLIPFYGHFLPQKTTLIHISEDIQLSFLGKYSVIRSNEGIF